MVRCGEEGWGKREEVLFMVCVLLLLVQVLLIVGGACGVNRHSATIVCYMVRRFFVIFVIFEKLRRLFVIFLNTKKNYEKSTNTVL